MMITPIFNGQKINFTLHGTLMLVLYGHHHLPLHLVVCRAATKFLHPCLSWAILVKESQEHCNSFISISTVLLQVSLGLPLFLFPNGVQCSAVLTIESGFLRSTCPIHCGENSPSHFQNSTSEVGMCQCWTQRIIFTSGQRLLVPSYGHSGHN